MPFRAIIDASSAILLARVGLIHLCCRQFDLCMSRCVLDEVTVAGRPGAAELGSLTRGRPGIDVLPTLPAHRTGDGAPDLAALDAGERHTLRHYLDGAARFVIIDDGRAVRVCRRRGIPHINALLCPKILRLAGKMPPGRARMYTRRIAALGRYSDGVRQWAEAAGLLELRFFIDKDQMAG